MIFLQYFKIAVSASVNVLLLSADCMRSLLYTTLLQPLIQKGNTGHATLSPLLNCRLTRITQKICEFNIGNYFLFLFYVFCELLGFEPESLPTALINATR